MLPVVWNPQARRDLGVILHFIREHSPRGAETINALVLQSTERLSRFPYMHREGREAGTREAVVHPNYLYVYRVDIDRIEILRVMHARQEYP
jgi:addiction module RelE/StbE family toxin